MNLRDVSLVPDWDVPRPWDAWGHLPVVTGPFYRTLINDPMVSDGRGHSEKQYGAVRKSVILKI